MVDVPIIGTGGIASGLDAAEMIMAGASLVGGLGSAVVGGGGAGGVFARIAQELEEFMLEQGYRSLESMRGIALPGREG